MKGTGGMRKWYFVWYGAIILLTVLVLLLMASISSDTPVAEEQQLMVADTSRPIGVQTMSMKKSGSQGKQATEEKDFNLADLTYALPEAMRVGETKMIKVIITPEGGQMDVDPVAAVEVEGEVAEVAHIPVGKAAHVKLKGEGYTIDLLTSYQQAILPGLASVWLWEVTPEKAGEQRLQLIVETTLRIEGTDTELAVYMDNKAVQVAGNFSYSLRQSATTYFDKLWELLLGGLLLPIVMAFIDRLRTEAKKRILPADILQALAEEKLQGRQPD